MERFQKRAAKTVKGLEHPTYKAGRAGTAQPGEDKAEGDLISVYIYMKGGYKEHRARLFSVVSSDKARSNGHKLKHQKVHQTIRKHLFLSPPPTVRVTKYWNRLPRGVVVSPSLEVFKSCLGDPA